MTDWFRSWHGAPTDPKWLGIAKRAGVAPGIAVAVAWALMDRASQSPVRGSISGYDAEGLAYFYGCEPENVEAIVAAMIDKGMIVEHRFTSWEKRQPVREDDSAKRVREHRERKKREAERNVTQRNAPEEDTDTDTATASDEAAAACAGPELDPQILESKLRDAAGDKMQPQGGFVVGPVMELIRRGADLDLDVLPTVRSVAARLGRPARSWDYFVPAIQDAMDKRKAAATWDHRAQAPPYSKPQSPAMQRHERIRQNLKRELYGDENADNAGPVIDLPERDYRPH